MIRSVNVFGGPQREAVERLGEASDMVRAPCFTEGLGPTLQACQSPIYHAFPGICRHEAIGTDLPPFAARLLELLSTLPPGGSSHNAD